MTGREAMTLEELSGKVEEELRRLGILGAQEDGRVSAVPDARTVRYYGTLGLVDRPAIVEREARYGRRHVLQLVAVKALQTEGLTLGQVQERVYGRSNPELEALLTALSQARRKRPRPVRALLWREVPLEPGVKLMVEEGWSSGTSPAALEGRIRAALAALSAREGARP